MGVDRVEPGNRTGARIVLDLPSRLDLVTVVRMVAAAGAAAADALNGDRLDDLRWAVSEAVTNAIEANQNTDDPGRVSVGFDVEPAGVLIEVSDEGPGMPDVPSMPEIVDPDRLMTEGGFGIPLMQMLSSSPVVFDSGPDGTTVRLELNQEGHAM